MRPFCRKSHVHKIPRFRGGGILGFGGGKCRFYFYGREDFSEFSQSGHGPKTCGCVCLRVAMPAEMRLKFLAEIWFES